MSERAQSIEMAIKIKRIAERTLAPMLSAMERENWSAELRATMMVAVSIVADVNAREFRK